MNLMRIIAMIAFIAVLGSTTGPGWFQAYGQTAAGPVEKVRFADGVFFPSAPLYIALGKGYFKKEGLEVFYSGLPSGKLALEAVLSGKDDFTTVADTPIVFEVMNGAKIYVIATFSSVQNLFGIVARRDQGISSARDLQGKKIGVPFGTNAHYFLDSFLLFNHIPRNEIRLTNVPPTGMIDAIMKGEVQAVVTWEPIMSEMGARLGKNALYFYGGQMPIYKMAWNLVARQDYVHKNPETVKRVLRALMKAEAFIKENRGDAERIITRHLGMDKGAFDKLWADYRSDISLNPLLVENLESQSRWAIRNKLTAKKEVPNYLQYIWFKGLESVKPEAITIVH